ncbi:hypothetical protein D3C75_909420 [compost metagenome]
MGQGGQQLPAFLAQHTQGLLHRHARFEQGAQQRNEGRGFGGELFLPTLCGGGQPAFGQQIAGTGGEHRGDPVVLHTRVEQPLDQQAQGQRQQRHAYLQGGEL